MLSDRPLGGRFTGRLDFERLVRAGLARAAHEGWPEMIWSDATFEDWPLREREVVESLQAWARSGRRLTLLAVRYDEVLKNQPRFVTWRRTWGHLVDCRRVGQVAPVDFPSAFWSGHWFLQRLDLTRSTGLWGEDPASLTRIRELLDEKLRGSAPGFPASVLGL